MAELNDEEKEYARRVFAGEEQGKSACYHCAGIHATVAKLSSDRQPCPRVKKIEYAPTGQVIAVEYWPWSDGWSKDVVFPDQVFEAE